MTAFAAKFDVRTGEIEFANAGHEPPFLRSLHGAPERIGAAGRGKRELLVPTEENVSEPRNRRVEISVR